MYVLFTKSTCPYCIRAIKLLEKNDVEYQYIDIDLLPSNLYDEVVGVLRDELQYKTVPMVLYNGDFIGGLQELKQHLE